MPETVSFNLAQMDAVKNPSKSASEVRELFHNNSTIIAITVEHSNGNSYRVTRS